MKKRIVAVLMMMLISCTALSVPVFAATPADNPREDVGFFAEVDTSYGYNDVWDSDSIVGVEGEGPRTRGVVQMNYTLGAYARRTGGAIVSSSGQRQFYVSVSVSPGGSFSVGGYNHSTGTYHWLASKTNAWSGTIICYSAGSWSPAIMNNQNRTVTTGGYFSF